MVYSGVRSGSTTEGIFLRERKLPPISPPGIPTPVHGNIYRQAADRMPCYPKKVPATEVLASSWGSRGDSPRRKVREEEVPSFVSLGHPTPARDNIADKLQTRCPRYPQKGSTTEVLTVFLEVKSGSTTEENSRGRSSSSHYHRASPLLLETTSQTSCIRDAPATSRRYQQLKC